MSEAVFLETFTRDPTRHSEGTLGPRGASRFPGAGCFSALPNSFSALYTGWLGSVGQPSAPIVQSKPHALRTSSGSRDNGRIQSSGPELHWIVVMRLNMIGNAGCNNFAFAQAHCAQRLFLQLTVRSTMPLLFVVQPSHRCAGGGRREPSSPLPLLQPPHRPISSPRHRTLCR